MTRSTRHLVLQGVISNPDQHERQWDNDVYNDDDIAMAVDI